MLDSIRLMPLGLCTAAAALLSLSLLSCTTKDEKPAPTKTPPVTQVDDDHDLGNTDNLAKADEPAQGPHTDHDHAHVESHGHDHDGDHEHAHDENHGHDHDGDHEHAHGEGHGHDPHGDHGHSATGVTHTINAIAFGGRAMTVMVEGSGAPGSELHVEGEITAGPATDTLRVWVGSEDGAGARKARMNITNGHFHVHVMIPKELLAGSALWFEAMTADGERQSVSMPL